MPRDLEGLADIVVLTVKNAIAPALERIALLEKENGDLRQRLDVVTELRDRVVVVETKAALPLPIPVTSEVPPVDIAPVLERLAALEQAQADTKATLAAVPELRDRVVVVETKAAMPAPVLPTLEPLPAVDLSPVLAALDAQKELVASTDQRLADLSGRVAMVETKAVPTATDIELAIRNRVDPVLSDVTAVRERVVSLEARAPIPGPPGKDGVDGKDGAPGSPGKDGADGLGFDDLDVEFDDRTLTLKFERGNQKKAWPITLPYLQYEGVYIEGKSYDRGSVVTWAGSTWHANEQTNTKPGEGSKAWTLIVKRGRDGKDGRDAMEPVPVVRAGGR